MKQIQLLLALICLNTLAFSQAIPNPDFENWTPSGVGSFDDPDGWATINIMSVTTFGGNPVSVTETNAPDVYSGTSACKIETIVISSNPFSIPLPNDTLGGIITGAVGTSTLDMGFIYGGRPDTLYFYYKFAPQLGDTCGAFVSFQYYDEYYDSTMTIGGGTWEVDTVTSNFTIAKVVMNYTTTDIPDTCIIGLSSSSGNWPREGTEMIVDALMFSDAHPTVSHLERDTILYDLLVVSTPVDIAENLVTWNDSATITGATVKINNNFQTGEDSLYVALSGGITGSYSAVTGTLMLSGAATYAQYQTVLRSVQYKNYASSPTMSIRRVDYTITDGVFTSNTGSKNVKVYNSTGIAAHEKISFKLFPSPAKDFITLENIPSGAKDMYVVDAIGNTVLHQAVSHNANQIDVRNLANGNYFVRLTGANQEKLGTRKFSVSK